GESRSMHSVDHNILHTRRQFFTSAAGGLGLLALASQLRDDGLLAAQENSADPLRSRPAHFEAKAKSCIFIFLLAGVSQVDLFDRKPVLQRLHGQSIPESF